MQPSKNHQAIKLSKLYLTSMEVRENFLFTWYCIAVKITAIPYVHLQVLDLDQTHREKTVHALSLVLVSFTVNSGNTTLIGHNSLATPQTKLRWGQLWESFIL